MSAFTTHLGLILYEDHRGRAVMNEGRTQWFLSSPLTYMVGSEDSGERITVPAFNPIGKSELEILAALAMGTAFVTDLGSIPQIAWSLGFSPSGPEAKAFVLHDLGCARNGRNIGHRFVDGGGMVSVSYSGARVDELLLEAMLVVGCDPHKSRTIYDAVRLGANHDWPA